MQDTTTFGSMVTYECNENYFSDGGTKPSRTCLSTGEWSNEDIQCSKSFEEYYITCFHSTLRLISLYLL